MKKLLLILLCLPMIGFGQACQYGSSTDASELCEFFRGNNFASNRDADIALSKILDATGMSKRFVLQQCNDVSNCVATSYKGIRYILYNGKFMNTIATRTNSWSNLSILAHEIGHHVNGHSLDLIVYASEVVEPPTLSESRQMELEADEYSGFVMYKLGASLSQAQEAIRLVFTNADDSYSTHPARDKRLRAIEKGYNKAKNQNSNNTYSSNGLTAEDYFYKGMENSQKQEYLLAIDNYNRCLNVDPNYYPNVVFFNRGNAYVNLENYTDAINSYNKSLKADPNYAVAYVNRGIANDILENYSLAIDDFLIAIKLTPDDKGVYREIGLTYEAIGKYQLAIENFSLAINLDETYEKTTTLVNRASVKEKIGNFIGAIKDYTEAIKIDAYNGDFYFFRGVAKAEIEDFDGSIKDFTKAIQINPSDADAYYGRGISKGQIDDIENACKDIYKAYELGHKNAHQVFQDYCQ